MFRVYKLKSDEKGQSLVEFALLLPILLLLLLGIIQFGVILSGYVTLSNSAREGARVGIIEKDNVAITERVEQAFDISGTLNNPLVTITFPESTPPETFVNGKPVSVKVTGDVEIIVPFLDEIFEGGSIAISRTSTMRVEGFVVTGNN